MTTATGTSDPSASIRVDGLSLYYALENPYSERLLAAGVDATIVTFAADEDWDGTLRAIDRGLKLIADSQDKLLVREPADLDRAKSTGRLGIIMGFQGSDMIGPDLWRVGLLFNLGLRCLQLTYSFATLFGDGCAEERNAGLSFLGRDLIDTVNEYPMFLDLSHCGHATTAEAIDRAKNPVCTHSNAFALAPMDRNKKPEALAALAAKGGIIGATALPRAVKLEDPTLDDLLEHMGRLIDSCGSMNVGLGLDFTEGNRKSGVILPAAERNRRLRPDIFGTVADFFAQKYPQGIEDISHFLRIEEGLLNLGYDSNVVRAVMGGNWVRHFHGLFR